ncbi:MAG: DNA repair protein RecO [Xanthomonadaceae bacterium]|nr:DNA repair protein RecO [Xanthomonadaceae bacterium]MDE2256288.1 DNA repair protein RecO [Xanthomonadaceae bacterium]
MTRVEAQPAFVLHARAWRETSLLLDVLSRDYGRVGLVARGVRSAHSRTPRSLLQPFAPLQLGWSGRGELGTLHAAEAAGAALPLAGESLLCALYVNELVVRLAPRHDPHPGVFAAYLQTLARLAQGAAAAWTLRRFERDLLAHLGYGLLLDTDADSGERLEADTDYAYRLEQGPVRWRCAGDGLKLRGSALLALARDEEPKKSDLPNLRRLLRALIAQRLDGVALNAWNLLGGATRAARG